MNTRSIHFYLARFSVPLAAVVLSASMSAHAQDGPARFSLDQAVDYALQHRASVLNAGLDMEIAHKKVNEVTGIGLPQVEASFDLQRFLDIPTTFVPAEFFGGDAGSYAPVQFGQKYNSAAGFTATQLLFDGSYIVGLQASRTYEDLSRKTLQQTRIDVALEVTRTYYNVLVNEERLVLLDANVARVSKLMDDTKAMYENGFVEKIDVDRIQVAHNNLVVERENTNRLLALGRGMLKFKMGMNPGDSLSLTDRLDGIAFDAALPSPGTQTAAGRIELDILRTNKRLVEMDLKKNRFQYLPSLVAYGSFSYNASRNEFSIFDSGEKWYPTSIVGAKLTLPIFDGLQKRARIQQARLNVERIENLEQELAHGIALEIETARTRLANAIASLETQKKNRSLASEVVRVTRIKYQQGVGSNIEVVDAETALKEAETHYYQALFDALIAKTEYAKATGTLLNGTN